MILLLTFLLTGCKDEDRPKRLKLGYKQPGTDLQVEEDVFNCGQAFMVYLASVKKYIQAVDDAQKGSTTAVKKADKLLSKVQSREVNIQVQIDSGSLPKRCEIEFKDKQALFKAAVNEFGQKPPLSKKEQDDIKSKLSCPVLCESRPKSEQAGCLNACIDKENRNYSGD